MIDFRPGAPVRPDFVCPSCAAPRLRIVGSLDTGADERSDEVLIQAVDCDGCGFAGVAVYEESRRGADEAFEHTGYVVSQDVRERVAAAIRDGRRDPPGVYLAGDEPRFPMRRSTRGHR